LPEYGDVPMIAVTGFSIYDDHGRALKSGFNAHLTKPINPMALLDLIKSLRD
jgi:CheY-like chemotaxis protein